MFTQALTKFRLVVVLVCLLAGAIVPPSWAAAPETGEAAGPFILVDAAAWQADAAASPDGLASSVQDEAILGGERDVWWQRTADGRAVLRLEWDGQDGDYSSLDHTGLGGFDLAQGGFQDHFVLEVMASTRPAGVTVEVWTDARHVSRYQLAVPGGIERATPFVLPFRDFVAGGEGGADWADVGAVALIAEGEDLAGLALAGLEARSDLTVSRTESAPLVAAGRGDLVTHTVIIANHSGHPSADLTFEQPIFERRARLVPGSVATSRGRVLGEGGTVRVAVGSLKNGESATITYEAVLIPRAIVAADLIVQDGDTPPGGGGGPVTTLNHPYTNGDGQVGFTGAVDNGGSDYFVWYDTDIIWLNSDWVTDTLTGAEFTMGIGNGGKFIYSPAVNGGDAVWTHNHLLAVENTPAPGFPPGTNSTFHSRPEMTGNGEAYWVSGFDDTGGTITQGRMLYHSSDATPGAITVTLRSDDNIGGFVIDRPSGIDFDYQVSDNGAHHIHPLLMDTGSTANDDFVYVDGTLVARETEATGQGDNWDNFDYPYINDAGNYLFSGDTDGPTATDEFIAYNGTIILREGDTLDGVTLAATAYVRDLNINNLGQATHIWAVGSGAEIVFFACDASNLISDSVVVLATGDLLDLDGDGGGDATVTDLNASGMGLGFAESGDLFVEVDLNYGAGDLEAIVRLDLPACGPNEAPIAVDDAYTTTEDLALTIPAPGVLDNDTDPNLDPMTAISATMPMSGALAFDTSGSFTYTPTLGFIGVDHFTYRAYDGLLASEPATVVITVTVVPNLAPIAVDDAYTTTEGLPLSISAPGVLGNDADPDTAPLPLTAVSATLPLSGALALALDGSFVYTPAAAFVGVDSFTYRAYDGEDSSAPATVVITVSAMPNLPPLAVDDAYTGTRDLVLDIPAPGVLENDQDPESNPLVAITYTLPASGSLVLRADGSFTYTPTAGFVGVDRFVYYASDGLANSNVATVTLTVQQPIYYFYLPIVLRNGPVAGR